MTTGCIEILEVMERLKEHMLEHKGKFELSISWPTGPHPPVWTAEMTNDSGSFCCTAYEPLRAIESLLGVVKS